MKLFLAAVMLVGSASAFSPQLVGQTRAPTELNLFGQGNKGDGKKAPGMMDQLAMFKKAQEVAQKKAALDKELQEMEFTGTAAGGKVTSTFKYMPVKNPMDPNPDYEMVSIKFDDGYYDSVSPEDLSNDVKEAFRSGVEETNKAVMQKYQSLTADLGEVLGGGAPQS